jgi:hypothetical protein
MVKLHAADVHDLWLDQEGSCKQRFTCATTDVFALSVQHIINDGVLDMPEYEEGAPLRCSMLSLRHKAT